MLQRTIAKEIDVSGISLHLGLDSNLKFKPAEPNKGVVFVRIDLPDSPQIKATVDNATIGFVRQTSIGNQDAKMHTIEHVMSALAGLGIDNIIIESSCEEPPAMDGSALPFIEALQIAGIVEQDAEKKETPIEGGISIIDKDKELVITPSDRCRITYIFKQDDPVNVMQIVSIEFGEESFIKEIAPARTFCFQSEVELLKSKGLGKGGSKENVVVINDDGKPDQPSRLENEMARHKILDLIGDLYLLGGIPKANIVAIKSGHEINTKLVRKLVEQNQKSRRLKNTPTIQPLDINEIKNILPHRFPFLMVDRIIELEEDKMAVGIKNVSVNEGFFQGHFPQQPIMPGVLQIEAMAQVAGILLFHSQKDNKSLGFFRAIENVKFRRPVVPGDQLRLEVQLDKKKGGLARFIGQIYVSGQLITEAEFTIAF